MKCHCMQCKDIQHSRGHEVLNRMRSSHLTIENVRIACAEQGTGAMLEAKRDELTRRHAGLVQCVSLRAAQLCFRRRLPIVYLRLPPYCGVAWC